MNNKLISTMFRKFNSFIPIGLCLIIAYGCSSEIQKAQDAFDNGDYGAAFRKLEPLAEKGNAHAQFRLGVMYKTGSGVLKDYKNAIK